MSRYLHQNLKYALVPRSQIRICRVTICCIGVSNACRLSLAFVVMNSEISELHMRFRKREECKRIVLP